MRNLKRQSLLFLVILACSFCLSCENDITGVIVVYSNDFEANDLTNISGGELMSFEDTQVLGNYNNNGFTLRLNGLPKHEFISVSFDLYIHDTWDGNFNGLEPDFPDTWTMELNAGIATATVHDFQKFETTFSNSVCNAVYCLRQSYPNNFPFHRGPRTGASNAVLPGLCALADVDQGTSLYNIEKTFRHDDPAMTLSFYDQLFQSNTDNPKCDESWSLDNLTVRAITID